MKRFFLNDQCVLGLVLANAAILFAMYFPHSPEWLNYVDEVFTILFWIEMCLKIKEYSWKNYWHSGWNKFDASLNILALPSLVQVFLPDNILANLSVLLVLRLFRIFRVFKTLRVVHYVPQIQKILNGIRQAFKASSFIILVFLVLIFLVSLINCALFQQYAPNYFGNPLSSMFSTFQMFSIEGWYEIPNTVASNAGSIWTAGLMKFYFVLLIFFGGMLGMSFITSIIVDAMAEDNNDEVLTLLHELKDQNEELHKEIEALKSNVNH